MTGHDAARTIRTRSPRCPEALDQEEAAKGLGKYGDQSQDASRSAEGRCRAGRVLRWSPREREAGSRSKGAREEAGRERRSSALGHQEGGNADMAKRKRDTKEAVHSSVHLGRACVSGHAAREARTREADAGAQGRTQAETVMTWKPFARICDACGLSL